MKDGWEVIFASHDKIDASYKAAEAANSNTRVVDACRGSVQIHLESLKFSMETHGAQVAKALSKGAAEHSSNVRELQKAIIEQAESTVSMGIAACTSPQQVFVPFSQCLSDVLTDCDFSIQRCAYFVRK